mgnify:FL=1
MVKKAPLQKWGFCDHVRIGLFGLEFFCYHNHIFMKIYLGSDHGGFKLKEQFKQYLLAQHADFVTEDCGALVFEPNDDYPPIAWQVAQQVAKQTDNALGVLFCRTGAGMVIVANKVKGIRAVELNDLAIAVQAKSHNHANVIAFGGDNLSFVNLIDLFETFLRTPFDLDPRHQRRLEQINHYEKVNS